MDSLKIILAQSYLNFTVLLSDGFLLFPDLLLQNEFISIRWTTQEKRKVSNKWCYYFLTKCCVFFKHGSKNRHISHKNAMCIIPWNIYSIWWSLYLTLLQLSWFGKLEHEWAKKMFKIVFWHCGTWKQQRMGYMFHLISILFYDLCDNIHTWNTKRNHNI